MEGGVTWTVFPHYDFNSGERFLALETDLLDALSSKLHSTNLNSNASDISSYGDEDNGQGNAGIDLRDFDISARVNPLSPEMLDVHFSLKSGNGEEKRTKLKRFLSNLYEINIVKSGRKHECYLFEQDPVDFTGSWIPLLAIVLLSFAD